MNNQIAEMRESLEKQERLIRLQLINENDEDEFPLLEEMLSLVRKSAFEVIDGVIAKEGFSNQVYGCKVTYQHEGHAIPYGVTWNAIVNLADPKFGYKVAQYFPVCHWMNLLHEEE